MDSRPTRSCWSDTRLTRRHTLRAQCSVDHSGSASACSASTSTVVSRRLAGPPAGGAATQPLEASCVAPAPQFVRVLSSKQTHESPCCQLRVQLLALSKADTRVVAQNRPEEDHCFRTDFDGGHEGLSPVGALRHGRDAVPVVAGDPRFGKEDHRDRVAFVRGPGDQAGEATLDVVVGQALRHQKVVFAVTVDHDRTWARGLMHKGFHATCDDVHHQRPKVK